MNNQKPPFRPGPPRQPITKETKPWLVQDANAAGESSEPIGPPPRLGPSLEDSLTRLLLNSEIQRQGMAEVFKQLAQITNQMQALLDALAEDEDPDQPTRYMDGTPI